MTNKRSLLQRDMREKNYFKAKTSLLKANLICDGGKVIVKVFGKKKTSRENGLEVPELLTVKSSNHSTEKGNSLVNKSPVYLANI